MQGPFYNDELSRRRAGRRGNTDDMEEAEAKPVKADWKDVIALTVAAYQILLPLLGVVIGVMLLFLVLFRWWAH